MIDPERKSKIIRTVRDNKVVAIFRGIAPDEASNAANAIYDGGIRLCEVTFRMNEKKDGFTSTLCSVRNMIYGKGARDLCVGVGTVLTMEQVLLAYEAGAEFVITPSVNPDIIRLANSLGMMTMPGAYSPTELETAYEAGADFIKIFPAAQAGASYFKMVRGPLEHIPLIAVGGVNLDNMRDFLKAGAVGVGIGGNLVDRKLIGNHQYEELAGLARKYADIASLPID